MRWWKFIFLTKQSKGLYLQYWKQQQQQQPYHWFIGSVLKNKYIV